MEQIVKFKFTERVAGQQFIPNYSIGNQVDFFGDANSLQAQIQEFTFQVYTTQEMDTRLEKSAKTISDLNELVHVLRQNVENLADINDALVRRIDEIERRVNQNE